MVIVAIPEVSPTSIGKRKRLSAIVSEPSTSSAPSSTLSPTIYPTAFAARCIACKRNGISCIQLSAIETEVCEYCKHRETTSCNQSDLQSKRERSSARREKSSPLSGMKLDRGRSSVSPSLTQSSSSSSHSRPFACRQSGISECMQGSPINKTRQNCLASKTSCSHADDTQRDLTAAEGQRRKNGQTISEDPDLSDSRQEQKQLNVLMCDLNHGSASKPKSPTLPHPFTSLCSACKTKGKLVCMQVSAINSECYYCSDVLKARCSHLPDVKQEKESEGDAAQLVQDSGMGSSSGEIEEVVTSDEPKTGPREKSSTTARRKLHPLFTTTSNESNDTAEGNSRPSKKARTVHHPVDTDTSDDEALQVFPSIGASQSEAVQFFSQERISRPRNGRRVRIEKSESPMLPFPSIDMAENPQDDSSDDELPRLVFDDHEDPMQIDSTDFSASESNFDRDYPQPFPTQCSSCKTARRECYASQPYARACMRCKKYKNGTRCSHRQKLEIEQAEAYPMLWSEDSERNTSKRRSRPKKVIRYEAVVEILVYTRLKVRSQARDEDEEGDEGNESDLMSLKQFKAIDDLPAPEDKWDFSNRIERRPTFSLDDRNSNPPDLISAFEIMHACLLDIVDLFPNISSAASVRGADYLWGWIQAKYLDEVTREEVSYHLKDMNGFIAVLVDMVNGFETEKKKVQKLLDRVQKARGYIETAMQAL